MKRFFRVSIWRKGFTLIELLIVIAVLGVLATVVMVAIDPIEQLARGRDAGRKSSITQLGKAIDSYTVTQDKVPTWDLSQNDVNSPGSWMYGLKSTGDIKTALQNPEGGNYTVACGTNGDKENGFCYKGARGWMGGTDLQAVVYVPLESKSEKSKCPNKFAHFAWNLSCSRSGIICDVGYPGLGQCSQFVE